MSLDEIVVLSNTLIMAVMLVATIYRIRIERKQIRLTEENVEFKKRAECFRTILDKEHDEILQMTPEEILEMLEKVWKD